MRREIGPIRALLNGIVCLAVLALAGFGVAQVAGKNWQVQETYRLLVEFDRVGGLGEGGSRLRSGGSTRGSSRRSSRRLGRETR